MARRATRFAAESGTMPDVLTSGTVASASPPRAGANRVPPVSAVVHTTENTDNVDHYSRFADPRAPSASDARTIPSAMLSGSLGST